ncbi:hypothetical protein MMC28_002451 [Mycoblastus sanguinarius]|nr:hypothetical protein [Mycoblastus sanguinarius]
MSSRYAAAHRQPQGPRDSRPTALDIVKDEGVEGKLSDKVVFITGCSSGIGIETARALNATGAKLFLTVRDPAKGQAALSDILKSGHVELLKMDLNSLDSVRATAEEFKKKSKTLNILINNVRAGRSLSKTDTNEHQAGVMATPEGKTADGFETQFGTNYLAHFLLFQLLKPTLLASSTPSFSSRVVALSSSVHRAGGVQFDNYNYEKGGYTPWGSYGQSKTAIIYMTNEIERRYGARGLHALSIQPGGIMSGLQKHVPDVVKEGWSKSKELGKFWKSPEQGAATTVWGALSKDWEGKGGKYLEDCAVAKYYEGTDELGLGHAAHAYNEEGEKKLWADSVKMLGLKDDE